MTGYVLAQDATQAVCIRDIRCLREIKQIQKGMGGMNPSLKIYKVTVTAKEWKANGQKTKR